jgi:hypothetical protein
VSIGGWEAEVDSMMDGSAADRAAKGKQANGKHDSDSGGGGSLLQGLAEVLGLSHPGRLKGQAPGTKDYVPPAKPGEASGVMPAPVTPPAPTETAPADPRLVPTAGTVQAAPTNQTLVATNLNEVPHTAQAGGALGLLSNVLHSIGLGGNN